MSLITTNEARRKLGLNDYVHELGLLLEPWQIELADRYLREETSVEDQTDEVRKFAVEAATSTAQVPLVAIQSALDEIDGELGRRMLLPEDARGKDTAELVRDVRAIRALQRYRLAIEGIGA